MDRKAVIVEVVDLVREVLNDNVREIRRLAAYMKESPRCKDIDKLSDCGETVLHIAVYKWNRKMVKIFLEAGANPNQLNRHMLSSVHVAAKLGLIELLKDLYYSGRCDLSLLTGDGLTALDLCTMEFNPDDDLVVMRSFKNWDNRQPDDTEIVRRGRDDCALFLREKMVIDHNIKLATITQQAADWMSKQAKLEHILSEPDPYHPYYSALQTITYPEEDGKPLISPEDQLLFEKFRIGVHVASEANFTNNIVQQALSVGLARASRELVHSRK